MSSISASPEFLAVFRAQADADGAVTFARFMALALYHPAVGYYRKDRPRVGRGPGTDFFTSASSGPIFGELVAAACVTLLAGRDPAGFTFVELGAEPAGGAGTAPGILAKVAHPFRSVRTIGLGGKLALDGPCVVFSNELFDAQPCARYRCRGKTWREIGVRLHAGSLEEVELPMAAAEAEALRATLPAAPDEGTIVDAPREAVSLLKRIAAEPWSGLFVAFDYGKSWREIAASGLAGTLRAYHRHRQSNDLLARPGEQDLTCHVCWDWLADVLAGSAFSAVALESQEEFFVHHAAGFIEKTIAAEAARFSERKMSLLQLLHPGNLGQKFQVLHGVR